MNKIDQQDYQLQRELTETGALLFSGDDVPLTETQWQALEATSREADYEHVIGGDAGEGHSVYVSRFVNDVIAPVDLQPRALPVKEIILSQRLMAFYQQFLGPKPLCLRRCQANLLKADDYIGRHIDQHSSPDYIASVVFHFDSDYQGGDFVSQPHTDSELKVHPKPHSVMVNSGSVWHEVEPVVSGERRTLACFFSNQFGNNTQHRKEFAVSSDY